MAKDEKKIKVVTYRSSDGGPVSVRRGSPGVSVKVGKRVVFIRPERKGGK